MKKVVIAAILVFAFVLSLNAVSAISTDIADSYRPGETIITEISGSILEPILATNVELKREHILVPFDYEIKRLGERYYLWFIAPEQKTNYTLRIKEITSYVSGSVKKTDYEKNFSVSGNVTDYSVKPGFILTDKDFEIKVQLNEDRDKTVEMRFSEETDYTLKPGENTIKFSVGGINETSLLNLSIGRYVIPVYIKSNKTVVLNITNMSEISNLTDLTSIKPNTPQEEEVINKERAKYHCYEFPGKICVTGEICSGESIVSLDGACCVDGDCGTSESGGSSYAWIGYLIAAGVVIGGIVIWVMYRKVKAEKNPLEKKIISSEKKTP